jgi:uncharacterized protein (TIGR03382 family)
MKTRWIVLAGVSGALVPWVAGAHPGHGPGDGWSLVHFVTEPVHGGAGILLAVLVLGALGWLRRTSGSR